MTGFCKRSSMSIAQRRLLLAAIVSALLAFAVARSDVVRFVVGVALRLVVGANELRLRNSSRRNAKPLSNEISSPSSKSPDSNHSSSNKERAQQANDFVTESDVIVERFHVRSNDDWKTDDRLTSSRSSDSRRLEIDKNSTEQKTSHFQKQFSRTLSEITSCLGIKNRRRRARIQSSRNVKFYRV